MLTWQEFYHDECEKEKQSSMIIHVQPPSDEAIKKQLELLQPKTTQGLIDTTTCFFCYRKKYECICKQQPFEGDILKPKDKNKEFDIDAARKYLQESLNRPATAYTKPSYYKVTIKGVEIDIYDIAEAFGLSNKLFNALKYILRCGKKSGEPKAKDLNKAVESINRELHG